MSRELWERRCRPKGDPAYEVPLALVLVRERAT
jgi:hypothetical protein